MATKKRKRISIKERLLTLFELAPTPFGGVHIEADTVGGKSRVLIAGVKKVCLVEEGRVVLIAGGLRLDFLGEGLFASSYAGGTVCIVGRILSVNAEERGERV